MKWKAGSSVHQEGGRGKVSMWHEEDGKTLQSSRPVLLFHTKLTPRLLHPCGVCVCGRKR